MKKHILLFLSLFTVVVLSIGIASCSEDPPPPTKLQVSMAVDDMTVNEDEGTIEVEMILDKPAVEDLIIEYEIDGSAVEGSSASSDYEIQGDVGEVEFQVGQTSATIEIEINNDNIFEGSEVIELTIQDTNTDNVTIGPDDETEITIEDNDIQATAVFSETAMTVSESDGVLEIEVELDNAADQDVTIEYTLSGSAVDSLTAWDDEDLSADYYIDGVSGEVEIEEGETVGVIRIQLYTDFVVEDAVAGAGLDPETIEITLTGANNGVAIGDDDKLDINLKQQDGRIILLDWADPTTDSADMDLFYWMGPFGSSPDELGTLTAFWSVTPSYLGGELVFIPNNISEIFLDDPDASFGVSYTYWGGNRNNLTFQATFIDIINGVVEGSGTRDTFNSAYTLANINEWDDKEELTMAIVQTFNKTGGAYTAATQIVVPGSGSRVRTGNKLPPNVTRGKQKPVVLKSVKKNM